MSHPDSTTAESQAQSIEQGQEEPQTDAVPYLQEARRRLRSRENQLRHECPAAHQRSSSRSPHEPRPSRRAPFPLSHKHRHNRIILPDRVDKLDGAGAAWGLIHHEGPFDCTYRERNTKKGYSPVDACRETHAATLRSTPPEFIMESLLYHEPLQGCAMYTPGSVDYDGTFYDYEQYDMRQLDEQNYPMIPKVQQTRKTKYPSDGNSADGMWFWHWFRQYRKKRKEDKQAQQQSVAIEPEPDPSDDPEKCSTSQSFKSCEK
ncbi:Pal1 cell morphology [Ascosphaera apis ARSEF 7405]|uniref:Pal1 cell morphology n=1 Tax=Ascosphaera apis ARSEF 7405 TaxID=392613 RepID=A0A167YYF1_9EURO|nr:Pal1 cell morphology [Ascosphaera apis ARSEF 7405]